MAAATLLKAEIYVFSKVPNHSQKYQWLCYQPRSQHYTVNQCSGEVKKVVRLSPPKGYHIELIHSFECHFDRVAPSDLLRTSMDCAPALKFPSSPSSIIVIDWSFHTYSCTNSIAKYTVYLLCVFVCLYHEYRVNRESCDSSIEIM